MLLSCAHHITSVVLFVSLCQDNWTALLNAAKQGFADVVELLLDNGANIEHRDTVSIL